MIRNILQDIRFGARLLARSPGFTVVAVIALALGIGANTAVFSVVNAVLLKPLPFPNPGRIMLLDENNLSKGWSSFSVAPANFLDWRAQAKSFERMAAFAGRGFNYVGGDSPESLRGYIISEGFTEITGGRPQIGRGFRSGDFQQGQDQVALLTHGFWQRTFAGDRGVVGKNLSLNGTGYTVIGVLQPEFRFGSADTALYVPWAFGPNETRGGHFHNVIAVLRPGVTIEQARREMSAIAASLAEQYPDSNKGWSIGVKSMHEAVVGNVEGMLLVLLGAVAFVLLIACANVANMLLSRAISRGREIAVRAALGAGRIRLVQQLLTESLMLSFAGGGIGLLMAGWSTRALLAANPGIVPRGSETAIDARVFIFAFAVAVLTGAIFGLVPALSSTRDNLHETLKEGGRGGTWGLARQKMRDTLVVTEVALALVLLIGSGLLIRSFSLLRAVKPGFRTDNTLTLRAALPRPKYPQASKIVTFFEETAQRISAVPGVESVVLSSIVPLSGNDEIYSIDFVGRGQPPEIAPSAQYFVVSPGYFRSMGINVLSGRDFSSQDREGAPRVAIISESFARRHYPNENPIGQRIRLGRNANIIREIVGVVGNVKLYDLADKNMPQVYEPFAQFPESAMAFIIRTSVEPLSLAPSVRKQVKAVDPEQPVVAVRSLEQIMSTSVTLPRFRTLLLGFFGGVALLLAAVGIYGVTSYGVAQRTQEIGVRIALGARRGSVIGLILRQNLVRILVGMALGLVTALPLARVMQDLVFGIDPRDLWTFATVPFVLLIVAVLATLIPAARATRVDPIITLRGV